MLSGNTGRSRPEDFDLPRANPCILAPVSVPWPLVVDLPQFHARRLCPTDAQVPLPGAYAKAGGFIVIFQVEASLCKASSTPRHRQARQSSQSQGRVPIALHDKYPASCEDLTQPHVFPHHHALSVVPCWHHPPFPVAIHARSTGSSITVLALLLLRHALPYPTPLVDLVIRGRSKQVFPSKPGPGICITTVRTVIIKSGYANQGRIRYHGVR